MLEYFKEQIKDELEGAKKYVQLAIETKLSNPKWSKLFLEMSSAELEHAKNLYKMFTDEIGPLIESFHEIPNYLDDTMNFVIEYYSEKYAEVISMHEAYKK